MVALLRVYPKRGAKSMVNISDAECIRLVNEVLAESENFKLHQVDVTNSLAVLSTEGSMFQK